MADAGMQQQFKEVVRDQWTHAAEAWREWHPKFSQMSREVTEAIVAAADLRPGLQVLDLAGGTGEPSLSVARAVAPDGTVMCTDFIPAMVATAEANARREGLTNMKVQQVDAEDIPFPDASFDRVTSRFGVMFFPNPERAFAGIKRVLRPGGRVAFTVWAPMDKNPGFGEVSGLLSARGLLQPPPPGTPTPFTYGEPGSLSAVLREAGFQQISEEPRAITWSWPGPPEEYWGFQRATLPAMRRAVEALDAGKKREIEGEILATIGKHSDGKSVTFDANIYVVTATS